jgi:hypothetical protein
MEIIDTAAFAGHNTRAVTETKTSIVRAWMSSQAMVLQAI